MQAGTVSSGQQPLAHLSLALLSFLASLAALAFAADHWLPAVPGLRRAKGPCHPWEDATSPLPICPPAPELPARVSVRGSAHKEGAEAGGEAALQAREDARPRDAGAGRPEEHGETVSHSQKGQTQQASEEEEPREQKDAAAKEGKEEKDNEEEKEKVKKKVEVDVEVEVKVNVPEKEGQKEREEKGESGVDESEERSQEKEAEKNQQEPAKGDRNHGEEQEKDRKEKAQESLDGDEGMRRMKEGTLEGNEANTDKSTHSQDEGSGKGKYHRTGDLSAPDNHEEGAACKGDDCSD